MFVFSELSCDVEDPDLKCDDPEQDHQQDVKSRSRQTEAAEIINNVSKPERIDVNLCDIIRKAIQEKIIDKNYDNCSAAKNRYPSERKEK